MLTRAHFPVLAPRGLITPANFQSMGFGLPAAMGASLGCPDKQVVAVLGDGGLAMSGMELLTAVREETNVLALVFNDGGLGLIRRRQLEGDGVDFSVNVDPPDLELFAEAVGVSYARLSDDADSLFGGGDLRRGVHLVEVPLLPTRRFRVRRARNRLLEAARTRVGRGYLSRLRRWVSTAGW
jgi:thiamine pyrophosphate-dependent acetolactate synthase large subunit-like protein